MLDNQQIRYDFESEAARSFPPYLMYDVINTCNAQCAHCPQSIISRSAKYKPLRLSWNRYKKTVEEARHYEVDVVRFTGDGETLLHPEIVKFISYAKDLGMRGINLTTNGSLLSGNLLLRLLENPPHVFDISLDALWPETYKKVRLGLDFEKVKANIFRLLELRNSATTKVLVSMVKGPNLEDEAAAFEEYWKDKVDFVAIRQMHTNLGLSGSVRVPENIERWPCQHLWQRLIIDYRGLIRYCPVDWRGLSRIGSVDDMSLYEAWHSSTFAELRSQQLRREFKHCGVCSDCKDWLFSPWHRGWLNLVRNLDINVNMNRKNSGSGED